jgi:RNA polymerase sigma factor (TIGR02999 family)
MNEFEDLLQLANNGDEVAHEQLFAIAYGDLRVVARAQLRRLSCRMPLSTSELLHESYLRFRKAGQFFGTSSGQFYAYAARVMRSVIIDLVRKEQGQRHGHGVEHVALSPNLAERISGSADEATVVGDLLQDLQKLDERLARVVTMRYWIGMTDGEIADALGVTDRTVQRLWSRARVVLSAMLQ